MKKLTLSLSIGLIAAAGLYIMPAHAGSEKDGGVADRNYYVIPHSDSQPANDVVFKTDGYNPMDNNLEGASQYNMQSEKFSTDSQPFTDLEPASGQPDIGMDYNNWEIHRLQRYYNGDDGVTK